MANKRESSDQAKDLPSVPGSLVPHKAPPLGKAVSEVPDKSTPSRRNS